MLYACELPRAAFQQPVTVVEDLATETPTLSTHRCKMIGGCAPNLGLDLSRCRPWPKPERAAVR